MCGIFACFGGKCDRREAVDNAYKQNHRGPDDFCCLEVTGLFMTVLCELVSYICKFLKSQLTTNHLTSKD